MTRQEVLQFDSHKSYSIHKNEHHIFTPDFRLKSPSLHPSFQLACPKHHLPKFYPPIKTLKNQGKVYCQYFNDAPNFVTVHSYVCLHEQRLIFCKHCKSRVLFEYSQEIWKFQYQSDLLGSIKILHLWVSKTLSPSIQ